MKRVTYVVGGKGKVAIISSVNESIPDDELYDRIFLPGKAAIDNSLKRGDNNENYYGRKCRR